jgi:mannopine transport system permease protein
VTLPLTLPGAAAAFLIAFTLGLGAYITPALLGGRRDLMIANLIDFRLRETLDWPAASAIAITLTGLVCALIALARRVSRPQH